MQNLLARGYQLRYYDADGKMLAVYVDATAWADVNEEENGTITAESLTTADPSAEDISAVSLSKLYVYYGGHEERSREGEGLWFILNPGKTDLTAETYTWKNDQPEGNFKQKVIVQNVTFTDNYDGSKYGYPGWTATAKVTCAIGGTKIRIQETWYNNGVADNTWDTTFILSQPLTNVEKYSYLAAFIVPAGTVVKRADGYGMECFNVDCGQTLTVKAGTVYHLNYAGLESYGVNLSTE